MDNTSNETVNSESGTNAYADEYDAVQAISNLLGGHSDDDEEEQDEPEEEEVVEEEENEDTEEDDDEVEEEEDEDEESDSKPLELTDETPIRVTVDGEEVDVPLSEIRNGYLRQKDYTQKTQALSEERKAIEAKAGSIEDVRSQYESMVKALGDELNKGAKQFEGINWTELAESDPYQYNVQRAAYQEFKEKQKTIEEENQRIEKARKEEFESKQKEFIKSQREALHEKLPEMKDKVKAKEFWENAIKYAGSYGVSPEELAKTSDHRTFLMLRDAMAFKKGQEAAQKKIKKVKAKPSVKPGSRTSVPSKKNSVSKRFKETGSMEDAASLIASLI